MPKKVKVNREDLEILVGIEAFVENYWVCDEKIFDCAISQSKIRYSVWVKYVPSGKTYYANSHTSQVDSLAQIVDEIRYDILEEEMKNETK